MPFTNKTIDFSNWWAMADRSLTRRRLRPARFGEAIEGYNRGLQPLTFAHNAACDPEWNDKFKVAVPAAWAV